MAARRERFSVPLAGTVDVGRGNGGERASFAESTSIYPRTDRYRPLASP